MKPMRVVLHCHSTWSYDGHWSLGSLARLFGAMGVRAVMTTEHDTGFDPARFEDYCAQCAAASTDRCLLVPGIEYSSPDNDVHILSWGVPRFLAEHRPTLETLLAIREAGGVAILAHPERRQVWRRFEPAWAEYLSGIEVWNRKTDGLSPSANAAMIATSFRLPAVAGVDFHRWRQAYPLWNRLDMGGRAPEAGTIIEAIRAGRLTPEVMGSRIADAQGALVDSPLSRAHRLLDRAHRRLRGR